MCCLLRYIQNKHVYQNQNTGDELINGEQCTFSGICALESVCTAKQKTFS